MFVRCAYQVVTRLLFFRSESWKVHALSNVVTSASHLRMRLTLAAPRGKMPEWLRSVGAAPHPRSPVHGRTGTGCSRFPSPLLSPAPARNGAGVCHCWEGCTKEQSLPSVQFPAKNLAQLMNMRAGGEVPRCGMKLSRIFAASCPTSMWW